MVFQLAGPPSSNSKIDAHLAVHPQAIFCAIVGDHVDRPTIAQTLLAALEWLWMRYPIP